MNPSIAKFCAAIGSALSCYLIYMGIVPDYVGIGYATILAAPFLVN